MTDKSSLLKSQGNLYLEFILKDGHFHKMLLLSFMGSLYLEFILKDGLTQNVTIVLMGFLTGSCNPHELGAL